jgi:hypothetical protein
MFAAILSELNPSANSSAKHDGSTSALVSAFKSGNLS